MSYPADFPTLTDRGGPGVGLPIGGFGGNPAQTRGGHRAVVAATGTAPVLLVHGNAGAAEIRPWDLLGQRHFLLDAGYPDELIWAPSYLGPGTVDLLTPHTDNVDDLRTFVDAVCAYLDVEVVDVIAHSLGCTLTYAMCRGLDRQAWPISWTRPRKWNRLGTFVALAGAFHGLGSDALGEWRTGGRFQTELLDETRGGGGETPYGSGDPRTPGPSSHRVTYFCATAAGDFVDAQHPGTGRLDGAQNRSYELGAGLPGHQAIKEDRVVFDEFRPLLNSVPPPVAAAATPVLNPPPGSYPSPLQVRASTAAPTPTATFGPDASMVISARRVTTRFVNGRLLDDVQQVVSSDPSSGSADDVVVTLVDRGHWQVAAGPEGASTLRRPENRVGYWVGVDQIRCLITTDNRDPFRGSLLVVATCDEPSATLYHSLDGAHWNVGATVLLTAQSAVSFRAVTSDGNSSEQVGRSFLKRVEWDDAVTATLVEHFLADRVGYVDYYRHALQFGYFTRFTLYSVSGAWVADPRPEAGSAGPAVAGPGTAIRRRAGRPGSAPGARQPG